jgi:accessory gene regulator B
VVSTLAKRCAVSLANYTERPNDKEYLRYGIEILLTGIFKMLCLFLTAYFFGILEEIICLSITFAMFRVFSGGHHYSTYTRCLIIGMILMNTLSYFSYKYSPILDPVIHYLNFGSVLFGLITCYKYAPSNHFYRKMKEEQKSQLKKFSIFLVSIWGILIFSLHYFTFPSSLLVSSVMGFLLQMTSMYPATYKIVHRVEQFIDKEVKNNETSKSDS